METLYFDTETTGLHPDTDEIVEVALVDNSGAPLLESLIKPKNLRVWPEAQKIHGISPDNVADAPILDALLPKIIDCVRGKRLVIYNAGFDLGFMPGVAGAAAQVHCCMAAFAERYGEWSEYHGGWRYQTLARAADYVGFEFTAHRAINDAQACRAVWRYLTEDAERERADMRRRELADEQEAARLLHLEENNERRAWHRFQDRMSDFWMRWLRLSNRETSRPDAATRKDEYCRLFFGMPLDLLRQLDRLNTPIKRYRKRTDIPAHLKPISHFKGQPQWVKDELTPSAYYLSESGRSYSLLYEEKQIGTVYEKFPLRKPYDKPGYELLTKTQLRKRGYKKQEIARMKPVREYQDSLYHKWHYLYEVREPEQSV